MTEISEKLILIGLIVMAVASVSAASLKRAIIYMGVFSLLASFIYLLYQAPDVAIAEAVIGCGLATVIYLVSIKRQRTMTVYYIHEQGDVLDDLSVPILAARFLDDIEAFFESRDLGHQVIHTVRNRNEIIKSQDYDLLVTFENNRLLLYGRKDDRHMDEVEAFVKSRSVSETEICVVRFNEDGGEECAEP